MVLGLGRLQELNGLGSGVIVLTVFKSHKKPSSLVFVPSLCLFRHGLSGKGINKKEKGIMELETYLPVNLFLTGNGEIGYGLGKLDVWYWYK